VRIHAHAFGRVPCSRRLDRIIGHRRRRRDIGNDSTIRAPEPKLAGRSSIDLITLFVNRALVATTEQNEV
jgi:hypothetical protein